MAAFDFTSAYDNAIREATSMADLAKILNASSVLTINDVMGGKAGYTPENRAMNPQPTTAQVVPVSVPDAPYQTPTLSAGYDFSQAPESIMANLNAQFNARFGKPGVDGPAVYRKSGDYYYKISPDGTISSQPYNRDLATGEYSPVYTMNFPT
jgi:hypothetical protein